jgi:periplasmic divalent cation tolerance protein
MSELLVVTTTWPSEADAARAAEVLVTERLAACAQVEGPIRSTYHWEGQLERSEEWYCHLKTTRARYAALEARIHALHSYDTPEIVATPVALASPRYAAWVEASVAS